MKKISQKNQLALNKETIADLNNVKAGQGTPGDANSWFTIITIAAFTTGFLDDQGYPQTINH